MVVIVVPVAVAAVAVAGAMVPMCFAQSTYSLHTVYITVYIKNY